MKLFQNLTFWVLLAITAGVLLGHFAPTVALMPVLSASCAAARLSAS
jgi:aerobic C4-dicarboxylate transport protein